MAIKMLWQLLLVLAVVSYASAAASGKAVRLRPLLYTKAEACSCACKLYCITMSLMASLSGRLLIETEGRQSPILLSILQLALSFA